MIRNFFVKFNDWFEDFFCVYGIGFILFLFSLIVLTVFISLVYDYCDLSYSNYTDHTLRLSPTTIEIDIGELNPDKITRIKQILNEPDLVERSN